MRKTKTTFLFRRMMLIVFAFLGYAAMTQAQVYVVDDFVNDSTPCFEYQLKEGKYLLPDDEPTLYLHNGDTINVFEMKHRSNGMIFSKDYWYYLFKKDGKKYAVDVNFIYCKADDPTSLQKNDKVYYTQNMKHQGMGRFFYTYTPYLIIIGLLIAIWLLSLFGPAYSKMRKPAEYGIPAMILAITFLEFLGLYFMGMDVFWWCDQNYYGFFGALFRVIPGVLVVMTQIGSIKLYENVIFGEKRLSGFSIKPTLYGMLGILPVSILILVLSQTTELTEEVLTVFWIIGVLLSLVIGFFLSLRENCEMVGKRKGILITAFIAIYLIGCIVAVICLGAMLLRLIIQVILVVTGAILILFVGSHSNSGGGGGGGAARMVYRDDHGNCFSSRDEANRSNERIAERRAESMI